MTDRKQPNILFFMSDDHAAPAIGAYGSRINETPQIDRIAGGGMRFDNCFCTNAICTPARASVLTGQYSHVNGVRSNQEHLDGTRPGLLQKVLRAAGYQTGIIGKWHLGHGGDADPTGFDYWHILPGQGDYQDPAMIEMGVERKHSGYVTDIITDQALGWLRDRDKERPFFLMCQHKAPHRPWEPSTRHANLFDDVEIPEPETFHDDYSHRARPAAEARMCVDGHLKQRDLKVDPPAGLDGLELKRWKYQRYIKDYLRCCAGVDESVGRLLDWLDEEGLTEDTVVVYTADHGFFLGEHGWYDKRFMYEESLRIPFLIRYPAEIARGTSTAEILSNTDFAPTLLDLAGIEVPEGMQGTSARPVLQGNTPSDWKQSHYYRYWMHRGGHNVCAHYGVRTHEYKLIYYYGQKFDDPPVKNPEWELFDLKKDPGEMRNVYGESAYAETVRELKKELARLQAQYQDCPEH